LALLTLRQARFEQYRWRMALLALGVNNSWQ
jgi:hypothetical protein